MHGTTVGQYRLSQKLGAGGMGVVYLAEHTLLGRPAAVKMLLPELSRNREVVTRFFNEARAATAIRHPGIVEIYDFGFDPSGAAYIVMELLRGESLATRARRGRMSYQSALAITRQVAGALAAAHAAGIVHRDLKPDNVFLVPDPDVPGGERIKLLDFGIAKLAREQLPGMEQMTQTGALMGTPRYMSPEQCRGVAVDHRSDLYSLGCMLFELVTGRGPFVGEGIGDVLSAHIHVPAPLVSSLAADAPPAIDQLVQRLLIKEPAQRLGTAEALVQAIDQAAQLPGYPTGPSLGRHLSTPPTGPSTGPSLPSGPVSMGSETVATGGFATPSPASLTTLSRGAGSLVSHPPVAKPRSRAGWIAGATLVSVLGGAVALLAIDRGGADRAATDVAVSPTSPASTTPPTTIAAPPPAETTAPPSSTAPPPAETTAPPSSTAPPPEPTKLPAPPASGAPDPQAQVALVVESLPPGAELVLDGAVLGKTPFRGSLPRAEREVTIIVRLDGYKDRKLVVRPDAPIAQAVTLDKRRARRRGDDRDDSVNPFKN